MAPRVPQRELRNHTATLLRRVEQGERLTITVHGHPVADLVPVGVEEATFVSFACLQHEMAGLLDASDRLDKELRELDDEARDPFA